MESLAKSSIGDVVAISGYDGRFGEDYEAQAFIPHNLPHRIQLPDSVWITIGEAMAELGRLDLAARLVPNTQLITRSATSREAVGTSALEGTFAEITELFAAEILPIELQESVLPSNVREVMNYSRAANLAYSWIKEQPLSRAMLSALQKEIVKETSSDGPEAGSIRTTQVFIGAQRKRVREARFIPTPPGVHLRDLYENWESWLRDSDIKDNIQLIVRMALAHYQFETIHPYTDGNGRIGRLVAILQLMEEGSLQNPVLSISARLQERSEEYRDHLLQVSITGDWSLWVEFFAAIVRDEAKEGHERIMRLLGLREEIGETVRKALPKARLVLDIADNLIAFPVVTVSSSQLRYGRSNQANRNAIKSLVDLGVLVPYSSSSYDRMYWCPRVIQAIES